MYAAATRGGRDDAGRTRHPVSGEWQGRGILSHTSEHHEPGRIELGPRTRVFFATLTLAVAQTPGATAAAASEIGSSPLPCPATFQRYVGPYRDLEDALERLRGTERQGGWPTFPAGPALKLGDRDARVLALRARLVASGDLSAEPVPDDPALFDATLDTGVRAFQARHGLEPDGVVGRATTEALNVPIESRIAQIEVNIDRWSRLPSEMGARYFLVNAAGFTADLIENGQRVRRFRVVVGRPDRPTPVFSAVMTHLILSPYWNVPPGIQRNDVLPRIKTDPGYLADHHMTLLGAATMQPVDPASVDWETMDGLTFNAHYRVREDPGPDNPLGGVKFMFPNGYSVYMHDTPAQDLLTRTVRTFSSGCIRVEGALDLAVYLLREDPGWTRDRIERVIERGVEQRVDLPTPYTVYVEYFTAWVDEAGVLQFRSDVYERDRDA